MQSGINAVVDGQPVVIDERPSLDIEEVEAKGQSGAFTLGRQQWRPVTILSDKLPSFHPSAPRIVLEVNNETFILQNPRIENNLLHFDSAMRQ